MNKSPVVEFSERLCRSFRDCCREKSLWTLEGESNTVPERTFFFCWISPLIPLDLGILSFMKTSQIKRTFSAMCRSEARSLSESFYWSFTAALLTLETLKKTWEVTAQSGRTVQTTGGLLLRYCTTPPQQPPPSETTPSLHQGSPKNFSDASEYVILRWRGFEPRAN